MLSGASPCFSRALCSIYFCLKYKIRSSTVCDASAAVSSFSIKMSKSSVCFEFQLDFGLFVFVVLLEVICFPEISFDFFGYLFLDLIEYSFSVDLLAHFLL